MTVAGQVDLRSATDDQLRTLVDTIRDALPNELTEPLKVLAEVSRRLTELQHRREAEAKPVAWHLTGIDGRMSQVTDREGDRDAWLDIGYEVRPLYAASPASGVRVKALRDAMLDAIERQYASTPRPDYGDMINAVVAAFDAAALGEQP